MALNIDLYSASYVLQLHEGSIYALEFDTGLGILPLRPIVSGPFRRGFQQLVATDPGNREAVLSLHIKGTSLDDWVINAQQLMQVLSDANLYWETLRSGAPQGEKALLSVQLNGMTNTIEFDVLACPSLSDLERLFQYPLLKNTAAPKLLSVKVPLLLKPYGHPQARTKVTSGNINNGGGTGASGGTYTLSSPAGEVEAPAKIVFQANAGNNFQRVIVARKSRGNVANFATLWPIQCETTGGTGYAVADIEASGSITLANVAVAAASGGNVLRLTHAANGADTNAELIRVTINDNLQDFFGTYRVWLRMDNAGDADDITDLSLAYGGTNGNDHVNPSVPDADITGVDKLYDLGTMTIPHRPLPPGVTLPSFAFVVRGSFPNQVFTVDFDCIYLVPVDELYIDYKLSAVSGNQDQLVLDSLSDLPMTTLLDNTGDVQGERLDPAAATEASVRPGVDNLWLALMCRDAANGPEHNTSDVFTLSFEYWPLYNSLR